MKPCLSDVHRKRRLAWAMGCKEWGVETWRDDIFTDESTLETWRDHIFTDESTFETGKPN